MGARVAAVARETREVAARGRAPTEVEAPGGAAVKVGGAAERDPRFRKVIEQLERGADRTKRHKPAEVKAAEAQAAAAPPANARQAGAKANQVDTMREAEAPRSETSGFLAVLREELDKVMPRTLERADKFMKGGEKEQVKRAVSGGVRQEADAAAGPIHQVASATPDSSAVPRKEVLPLSEEKAPAPPPLAAAEAVPAPRPEADVAALGQAKQEAARRLQGAELTPQQLQRANDPRFSAVLTTKARVDKVAAAAPGRYHASERAALAGAITRAQGDAKAGLSAMVGTRAAANAQVTAHQQAARKRDEQRRKEVTDNVERIYARTKQRVEAKLGALELEVMRMFDAGLEAALSDMKEYANREIDRFKEERYAGLTGKARWVADLFRPVPEGIKTLLRQARARFTPRMDALAVRIASRVDQRLKEAKEEIARGQAELETYVNSLPKDLRAVGREAEQAVASRFEALSNGLEEKKRELAQKLAGKYKEAHDQADTALKKLEEENAGALKGLTDAVGEVIKVLTGFKDKLMAVLRKGADTLKRILADPIQFLSNLITAIKQGVRQFVGNVWTHLKAGFMQWLFSALAQAGIPIPSDLSLPSILKLALAVLGLTYEKIRPKAVRLLGERAVGMLEKLAELVQGLFTRGPAALWEELKSYLGGLKAMVIDALQSWLVDSVIKSAVTKLLSMFNPAGAIVQAVIAIYNTVMFFIERASQIASLIEAVINSVGAIASGAIAGAARWIEQALARAVPVVIGFLARLIGLGNVSGKIREIILKAQELIDRAIDWMLEKIVQVVKKLFGKITGKEKKDTRTNEEKVRDLREAVGRAQELAKNPDATADSIEKKLPVLKSKYRLTVLSLRSTSDGKFEIHGEINPVLNEPLALSAASTLENKLIKLKIFGSSPNDIRTISKRLMSAGEGAAIAGFILSERFDKIPNYKEVLSQIKNKEQIYPAYMALSKADELLARKWKAERLIFEKKAPKVDIDLVIIATDGAWAIAYQFKRFVGELKGLLNSANKHAKEQLDEAPAKVKWMIIEVTSGTYADYLALPPDRQLTQFRSFHPTVQLKVTFRDGKTISF